MPDPIFPAPESEPLEEPVITTLHIPDNMLIDANAPPPIPKRKALTLGNLFSLCAFLLLVLGCLCSALAHPGSYSFFSFGGLARGNGHVQTVNTSFLLAAQILFASDVVFCVLGLIRTFFSKKSRWVRRFLFVVFAVLSAMLFFSSAMENAVL